MNWKEIRENYPLVNRYTYLNTARAGAMSLGTAQRLKDHIDDFHKNGALHREDWEAVKESARNRLADLMEVGPSDIGFLTDVSTGMSFLATAMKKDRKVLLVEDDFPSVGIPWIRSGYEISWIKKEKNLTIDLHKIEDSLKKGVDILVVSWVQYNSGYRIDLDTLGELCSRYDTKLIIDGTQGFCAKPVFPAKSNVQVFMASGFKWVTAGYGVAMIYIDPALRKELKFEAGGWNSLVDFYGSWEEAGNYKPTVEILELAHPKFAGLIALDHALVELEDIGLKKIGERIACLSSYLKAGLEKAGIQNLSNFTPEESSGINLLRGDGGLYQKLTEQKFSVTFREDYLRVATHFYNEEEDLDRLIQAVGGVET